MEAFIEKNRSLEGNQMYIYPGQLAEDDDQLNGGDREEIEKQLKPLSPSPDSDLDSWGKADSTGENSEHSFNSAKMIDGYKEFWIESLKYVKEDGSPKKDTSPRRRKRRDPSLSLSAVKD